MFDVKKDEKIEVFDPTLSYELTGYRPIDRTHGLDFKISWFTEARDMKIKTGHYTKYPFRSKRYNEFAKEEYRRCREGYTSHGYTITGDHYFFLNYYQLQGASKVAKAAAGRTTEFPDFYVTQYMYFHYLEMARIVFMNACGAKARGVGFSEIGASVLTNLYSTVKNSQSLISVFAKPFLVTTFEKVTTELHYLNTETDGMFKKLRQKKDSEFHKKASHVNKDTNAEEGYLSEIIGLVADKSYKIRGKRVELLLHEEAGSNPILEESVIKGEALIEVNGQKVGTQMLWGTGGDSGPNLEGLMKIFLNPRAYNVLPYRHNYTQSGEYVETGFFVPAFSSVVPHMDSRGWCDPEKGRAFYEKKRSRMLDPEALLKASAEYCFTIEEVFALEGDNDFNRAGLVDQKSKILILKEGPVPRRGHLSYKFGPSGLHHFKNVVGVNFETDTFSKLRILEDPITDASGNAVQNLYVAGIDSIDIGVKDTSANTVDPSDFCIVIYKRSYGLEPGKFVAIYKDRPNDIKEAYKMALMLLVYYNCKAVLEASRVSLLNYFKDRKIADRFLMRRPQATINSARTRIANTYGCPATPSIIKHQLELIASFTFESSDTIWFPEMIEELLTYSYEAKTKFDIVAAMGMALLGAEELDRFGAIKEKTDEERWIDIGWYIDPETGLKKWGALPNQATAMIKEFSFTNGSGPRTANPYFS